MSLASCRRLCLGSARVEPLALVLAILLAGCGPSDPLEEIRKLHASGRYEESLEPLRSLVKARPADAELHYLHGLALVGSGQPSLSLWSFRKAMETPEWFVPAGLQLAAAALGVGNHEAAIEAAGRILEAEPEHLAARVLRARARVESRRDYEGALADADRALELSAESLDALVVRAVALLGLERIEEAGAALAELERRSQGLDPGLDGADRFCAARAAFAKAKGDAAEADRRYRDCLDLSPASTVITEAAIEFYEEQQRFDRVLEILRAALDHAPLASGHRLALATRLRRAGEVEQAERILLEGTELESPAGAQVAWVDLGDHYLELEEYAAAASALERALDVGGETDPQLAFHYADALVMAGRYERALEVARGIEVPAYRHLVQGRVSLARGRPAEALEQLSAGLRLWPNNAGARYYAARAAEGMGDFDRAISEYRYSIRTDPGATDARLRLARLHEAEGDHALALTAATQHVGRFPAGLDLQMFVLRLQARLGRRADVRRSLARLVGRPEWGRAVAAAAAGMRDRRGPRAAARLVREAEGLDLGSPANAQALRALVVYLGETDAPEQALSLVEAALARHPDAAVLHEIHGLALAGRGAPVEEVRASYERALELDPDHAPALAGLGQLAADAGDAEAALDLYSRAAAADRDEVLPLRASSELLISLGRREEAEQRLAELLERDPYDAGAAARLAELRLEREAEPDRTLELARRAVRFGGGPEAYELLARVHERRGEAELASEASLRAEAVRSGDSR